MKNVVVLGVILALMLGLFFSIKSCRNERTKRKYLETSLAFERDSFSTYFEIWKDRNSLTHYTTESVQLDRDRLNEYIKELEEKLNVKPKQIEGKDRIVTETKIQKELVYVDKDSTWRYKDNYIDVLVTEDSSFKTFTLDSKDTLVRTTYWKRKWLLSDKKYYTDISNTNPYNKTTSIISLQLADPKPVKFILGPVVGVGWNGKEIQPYIGVGAMFYPLSFKIR